MLYSRATGSLVILEAAGSFDNPPPEVSKLDNGFDQRWKQKPPRSFRGQADNPGHIVGKQVASLEPSRFRFEPWDQNGRRWIDSLMPLC
jgi:hypothetical protein